MAENFTDPQDIASITSPGEYLPTDQANQAVEASGEFDADHQVLTPGLSTSDEPGFHVVTPLVTETSDPQVAVAIIQGWLPETDVEDGAIPPPPDGEVTVEGWLTPPQQEPAEGYSAVDVPDGHVERIAPAVLVNEWPYQPFEGSITQTEPDTTQLAAAPPVETPEKYDWNYRSLGYAGQWALFGVVGLAFWGSLVRREVTSP